MGRAGKQVKLARIIKSNRKPVWRLVNEDMIRWKRGSWGQFHILENILCFYLSTTAYHLNTHHHDLDCFIYCHPFSCFSSLPWAKTLGLSLGTAEQDFITPVENRFILGKDLPSHLATETETSKTHSFWKDQLIQTLKQLEWPEQLKIGVSEKQSGDFQAFFLMLYLCQMRIQNEIEKALLNHVQVSLRSKTLAEERNKNAESGQIA